MSTEDQANVAVNSNAQSTNNITPESNTDSNSTTTPENNEVNAATDTGSADQTDNRVEIDYSKAKDMSTAEKFDYLKDMFSEPNKVESKKEDTEPENTETDTESEDQANVVNNNAQSEEEYEIKVAGKSKKVSKEELIRLAQQGDDYTAKTQKLAEERRELEALRAALKVRDMDKTPAVTETKPEDAIKSQYESAVAEAAKAIKIKPEDFNQFDPLHSFALQQAMTKQNQAAQHKASLQQEVTSFFESVKQDPMAQQINDNFDVYIFKLGSSGAEGAAKARAIAAAEQRFLANQGYTKQDLDLLKAHWDYVKAAINAPTSTATTKNKPEPPRTEAPGQVQKSTRKQIDYKTAAHFDNNEKFEFLKSAGIF